MTHDSEKQAASYLGGEMSTRRRVAFEQHILECEDCWREVAAGRTGRAIGESARELAPQSLRELVRASVAATPVPRRGRRWALAAAATLLTGTVAAVGITSSLTTPGQPRELRTLLSNFEGERAFTRSEPSLPKRLGDLRLRGADVGRVGSLEVVAHRYTDAAGHVVVVYQADDEFPVAAGASHDPTEATWTATIDGMHVFCSDKPIPSLVVGDDAPEVELAAQELGLK
ncbi:MAG: anti-sigma factor family protein [Actinomycetota bacterium]